MTQMLRKSTARFMLRAEKDLFSSSHQKSPGRPSDQLLCAVAPPQAKHSGPCGGRSSGLAGDACPHPTPTHLELGEGCSANEGVCVPPLRTDGTGGRKSDCPLERNQGCSRPRSSVDSVSPGQMAQGTKGWRAWALRRDLSDILIFQSQEEDRVRRKNDSQRCQNRPGGRNR